jgi:hypothetical protein
VTEETGTDGTEALDLRILTPGLSDEEIAAVTSVVAAMLEAQRGEALRESSHGRDRWRRSFDLASSGGRGPSAWRSFGG